MSGPEDLIDAGRVPSPGQLLMMQADLAAIVERRATRPAAPARRFEACREDCTTDCGHCKGHGRPAPLIGQPT